MSAWTNAVLPNAAEIVTDGEDCAAAGFTSSTPKTSTVSPNPGVPAMTALLCEVMEITNVPRDFVHTVDSTGEDDPTGTTTPVRGIDPDVVTLPLKPLRLMTGVQDAKSGTLNVKLTVIVLLSQGYGDD